MPLSTVAEHAAVDGEFLLELHQQLEQRIRGYRRTGKNRVSRFVRQWVAYYLDGGPRPRNKQFDNPGSAPRIVERILSELLNEYEPDRIPRGLIERLTRPFGRRAKF